jgi:hypothetical protein
MTTRTTNSGPDARLAAFESELAAKGYRPRGWLDVIDTADFHDHRTNQKVDLDRDRLQQIADRRNRLVTERRSVSHYCLGHTDDDSPEWEQPPLAGLATRWRVGQYGDGTPNLEAYSWERPGHEGVFDEYPQRSAELFLNPDDINPIALLKSTTPRRDLSLRLSAKYAGAPRFVRVAGRRPIFFQLGGARMNDHDTTQGSNSGDLLAQLLASDEWKQLVARVDEVSAFVQKAGPIFEQLEQEAEAGATPDASPVAEPAPATPVATNAAPPTPKEGPATKNSHGFAPVRLGAKLPDGYDGLEAIAAQARQQNIDLRYAV